MNRRQINALASLGFTTKSYFEEDACVWGLEVFKDGEPVQLIEQKPRSAGGVDNAYYTFGPSQGKGALARKKTPSGKYRTQREAIAGYLSAYYSLTF